MRYPGKLIVLIAVLNTSLAACGNKKTLDSADVAVKVNGEAISVVELQNKMRQQGQFREGQENTVSGAVLNSQIDMELFRQAAMREKLDSDKSVHARLAESNRFILAIAYMDKQMAGVAKPGESEIKAYFDQHPEHYAERKQYDLEELRIQAVRDNAVKIKEQLDKGTDFSAFVRWLNGKKIPNDVQQLVLTADQMPEEILEKLKNAKAGEAIAIDNKDQLNVIFVTAVKSQPVLLGQASPTILKILDEKHKRESLNNILKQLRGKAKIEYVPPYTEKGTTISGNE